MPYRPVHAKTIAVDGAVALIGSASLDRPSFELNFENNMMFARADFTGEIRARQTADLADCEPIPAIGSPEWGLPPVRCRISRAMLSPVL
ncbi:phospholipase D-like domain-containing protein [Sphingopyxis flava]|uniref:phospholipase D-like domain-containing protein n=1 Tax=Sphingopyxis flava TaxID=1507287 RepID=UPI0009A8596C|nr:phospholipase D-like domain-containing protein [Sphingopyxis flava]